MVIKYISRVRDGNVHLSVRSVIINSSSGCNFAIIGNCMLYLCNGLCNELLVQSLTQVCFFDYNNVPLHACM